MKKILSTLAVVSVIVIAYRCVDTDFSENPVSGKWKSLWAGSQNKAIDFNISFESNNTFHVTAFGMGQTQPQNISGIYKITQDTMMILDKLEEPKQLCNYADTGMYTLIKRGDTLLFKVINDGCERKLTLEMGLIKSR